MAKRSSNRRIEPTFDAPSRDALAEEFSVSEEDRAVPAHRSSPKRSKAPARSGKSARSARRRRSGGWMRGFGRLFYWAFVLAIWVGIGGAGSVAYYGAQMPRATS